MDYKKGFILFLILLSPICSNISNALGFGSIELYSYLNEPLVAEIKLAESESISTYGINATLASNQDFDRAKIDRLKLLKDLNFEILRSKYGTYILVTSTKPIKSSFLEFLVELSWLDSKIVKGYTVILDKAPKDKSLRIAKVPKALSGLSKEYLAKRNIINFNKTKTALENNDVKVNKNAVNDPLGTKNLVDNQLLKKK